MEVLQGKKIILGVSGSIAAYKAVYLLRLLLKAGAEVQVIMTPASTQFVSPLTFSTLSQRPVFSAVLSEEGWNNHVELGLWADAIVLAPATANTLAKLAHGICDTIVQAVYLSARCPVFFAPAMDLDMWAHPSTQANVRLLQTYGNHLIDVAEGELASGLHGKGRMAEPEDILAQLQSFFEQAAPKPLKGKLLVTAGPTYEAIDPVRFIGNHSTGSMGIAIARSAAARGAQVTLVLGPSQLAIEPHPNIRLTRVQSAQEMYEASLAEWPSCQAAILAAAVADYRPAEVAQEKIKKSADEIQLRLIRNPDIAKTLGGQKQAHQKLIGFAMETQNGLENAARKLQEKNMDFIVLNSLRDPGAGFGPGTNKVSILSAAGETIDFPVKSKTEVAEDILNVCLA